MVFGIQKVNYKTSTLKELVQCGKTEEAQEYINSYFIKVGNPVGCIMWTPSENALKFVDNKDVKSTWIKPKISNGKFDALKWWNDEVDEIYFQSVDVTKGRIYSKCGQEYINLFPGFLHTTTKKYNAYPESIKDGVDFIWKHVKDVWCSGQEESFKYTQQWFANMISGSKMQSALYLKSQEGTGKSTITDFIKDCVLGRQTVIQTSDPTCIMAGKWNDRLVGKVLLLLEEAPTATPGEWMSISNSLKHLITGNELEVHKKYHDDFTVENHLSIIINTNNNAICLTHDSRRYMVLDISNEKIGNTKYFDKLYSYTTNEVVGEAFYWWCKENADPAFKANVIPQTQNRTDLVVDNLHVLYNFIKYSFVLKNLGIDMAFTDFYQQYVEYCEDRKHKPESKIIASKKLKDINIKVECKTNNVKFICIDKDSLLKIYKDKNWIHYLDEFAVIPKKTASIKVFCKKVPVTPEESDDDGHASDVLNCFE